MKIIFGVFHEAKVIIFGVKEKIVGWKSLKPLIGIYLNQIKVYE